MEQNQTNSNAAPQVNPSEAVLLLQNVFRKAARHLRAGDPATQDDLVQEMSVSVLRRLQPAALSFFLKHAVADAMDYLDAWKVRSAYMESLEAHAETLLDGTEEREQRRAAAIDVLERHGLGFLLDELQRAQSKKSRQRMRAA